ncbi:MULTISPECIES: LacI family DNA-binding transcriptional regulator [Metabacillus]|uniref:LacI family transcriptional regulator n=2 Tax=Metabacillus TaxID=2675233 RepID=A0A179T5Q7_9BACI|nr:MULTISPECIES: LacI family DNA-binding transcriptional regulator [Metabacillus]OAS87792.1 LacI family transcriptional regulator [Metabacillus litoralis]QNF27292.1 LacI family DNA-binding transcriptional regulator [Metabacillus sp. KUDC1714]
MTVTILDVAKRANVSKATVSRVLNDQGGYSEKTKRHVLKVMEELEYNPNAVARSLTNKRTQTIGIVLPDLISSLTTSFLNEIEAVAHKAGSSVIVCHTESKGTKTMKYLQLLHEKRVDGVILASTILKKEYYDYIKKTKIPMVLLSTDSKYPVSSVTADDYAAAYMATKYLIQQGHKKVGMISGNKEEWIVGNHLPRVEGFKAALLDNKLSVSEKHVVYGGFSCEDGAAGLTQLFKQVPDLTAIFTENDEIGMGVISAAYQLGIKVPEEVSVIGMDNVKFCEYLNPPLTSVSLSHSEMAKKAANLMFEIIESNKAVTNCIVPHRIVERQSVSKK